MEKKSLQPLLFGTLVAAGIVGSLPAVALGSSAQGHCLSNIIEIGRAIKDYQETFGTFPKDICDKKGNPLLSWRVLLLPFLESQNLSMQFHRNEPWDSPHNRKLIDYMPNRFRCPSSAWAIGSGSATVIKEEWKTPYLMVRRKSNKLLSDRLPSWNEVRENASTTIILIEADKDHSVIWTKPDDWHYDPAAPFQGLGKHHGWNFRDGPGAFVIFADGDVRFLPQKVDEGLLRSLFALEKEKQVSLELPWEEALWQSPIGFIMGYSFLIGFCAIAGIFPAIFQMIRGKPTSPGEFLWFIVGLEQLAFLLAVFAWFRYEPLPKIRGYGGYSEFWFLPSFVGTLACMIPIFWYRSFPFWRILFVAITLVFVVFTWDATFFKPRGAEESFMTAASPMALGIVGLSVASLTLSSIEKSVWENRWFVHWTGIIVCLLPTFWYGYCLSEGLVPLREFVSYVID